VRMASWTQFSREAMRLTDRQLMEDWQIPLMKAMADIAAASHGDVLEIGFGRGISAGFIQDAGVGTHTIIECNPLVIDDFFRPWSGKYSDRKIRLLQGKWQDVIQYAERCDGILFHAYPLTLQEYVDHAVRDVTFAAHFFETASNLLRPNGAFTYLTHEIDSLSRAHQRSLLRHFSRIELRTLSLVLPPDSRDLWWADSMVVVRATK
jgi:guanidinoacetate N-methyltransferase